MRNKGKRCVAALLVVIMCFTSSAWNGNSVWAEESSNTATAADSSGLVVTPGGGELLADGDTSDLSGNVGAPGGGEESGNIDVPTAPESGEESGNVDVPNVPEGGGESGNVDVPSVPEGGGESGNVDVPTVPEGGGESGNVDVPSVPEGGDESKNGNVPETLEGDAGADSDPVESDDIGGTPDSTDGLEMRDEEELSDVSELDVAPAAAAPRVTTVPEVEHNKRLVKNSDGTYTMTLDVTGLEKSTSGVVKQKAEIVIVQDISGSMIYPIDGETDVPPYDTNRPYNEYGGIKETLNSYEYTNNGKKSRINQSRDAVESLLRDLSTKGILADAALVTYTGQNDEDALEKDWKTKIRYGFGEDGTGVSISKLVNAIPQYGTTYDSEFQGAGLFYYYKDHWGTRWDLGADLASEALKSSSQSDTQKYILFISDGEPTAGDGTTEGPIAIRNHTVDKMVELGKCYPDMNFFFLQMRTQEISYDMGLDYVERKVDEGLGYSGRTHFYAVDAVDEMADAFQKIQAEIDKENTTLYDVEITDTLSDYVEFVDTNWNPEYGYSCTTDAKKTQPASTRIDKTVTMKIPRLTSGETHSISFKVRPSQKAYNEYSDNNGSYPDTAGVDTGTHSLKGGFHSNEKAVVKYGYAGLSSKEFPYKHPVVQVELMDIPVEKKWEGLADSTSTRPSSVKVHLYRTIDGTDERIKTITLTSSGGWKDSFKNVAPILSTTKNQTYRVEEEVPPGYAATIFPAEMETGTANNTWLEMIGVEITNKAKSESSLTIKKVMGSGFANPSEEFTVEVWISKSKSDYDGTLLEGETIPYVKTTADGKTEKGDAYFSHENPQPLELDIKGGETIELQELPRGYYYKVEETEETSKDYTVVYTNKTGQFTAGDPHCTVTIENSNIMDQELVIKKVMGTGTPNPGTTFKIKVWISADEGDYDGTLLKGKTIRYKKSTSSTTYSKYMNGTGPLELSIKADEMITLLDLPRNYYYKVEEAEESARQYTVAYTKETGQLIEEETLPPATITNSNKTDGILTIKKEMGEGLMSTRLFKINVWISTTENHEDSLWKGGKVQYKVINSDGTVDDDTARWFDETNPEPLECFINAGQTIRIEGIPKDFYYKVEEDKEYSEDYTVDYGNKETGQFTDSELSHTVIVTNTNRMVCSLQIEKEVPYGFANPSKDFIVQIWISKEYDDIENTLIKGRTFDYTRTKADGTKTTGSRTFSRYNPKPIEIPIKAGEKILLKELPVGYCYKVEEKAESAEGFDILQNGSTGYLSENSTTNVTIENAYKRDGTLTIEKEVVGENEDPSKVFTIQVRISENKDYNSTTLYTKIPYIKTTVEGKEETGEEYHYTERGLEFDIKAGEKIKLLKLPLGYYYEVVETKESSKGYNAIYRNQTGQFTSKEKEHVVTVTNMYEGIGSLTIKKQIAEGLEDKGNKLFYIQVRISAFENKYDAGELKGEKISYEKIKADGTTTTSTKTFYKDGEDPEPLEFSLYSNETIRIKDLPLGYYYSVEEVEERNYQPSYEPHNKGQFTKQFDDHTVTVTNTNKMICSLDISKEVPDGFVISDKKFRVKIWISSDEDDYDGTLVKGWTFPYKIMKGNVEVESGERTFDKTNPKPIEIDVKAGETIRLEQLPVDYHYKVEETEESSEGYKVKYDAYQDGSFYEGSGENRSTVITNEKENPGNISITKKVKGLFGNRKKAFEITLTLSDGYSDGDFSETVVTGPNGEEILLKNKKAVLHLKHGETAFVTGLPKECKYTVEETDSAIGSRGDYEVSYDVVANSDSEGDIWFDTIEGRIKTDAPISCTITNTSDGVPETGITGSLAETGLIVLAALLLAGMIVLKILQYRFKHK